MSNTPLIIFVLLCWLRHQVLISPSDGLHAIFNRQFFENLIQVRLDGEFANKQLLSHLII
jgi:hypothetical protein